MESTIINHPRLRVDLRTGSEGPKHDPYHFEEYRIRTPDTEVVVHLGLGDWVTVGKTQLELVGFTDKERAKFIREDVLKRVTGYTMTQLERIARKRSERCANCSGKVFESVCGFPGEHLTMCSYCGHIVDNYFCISEVE